MDYTRRSPIRGYITNNPVFIQVVRDGHIQQNELQNETRLNREVKKAFKQNKVFAAETLLKEFEKKNGRVVGGEERSVEAILY